ncbi:MAG TPA: transferrin receptor-like dimerization domain-containing protein [Caulobacteraceae bacterium]|nr:transferrin receptor-like dimerization domain-containing protein [Caulobacteraceae bacterium]
MSLPHRLVPASAAALALVGAAAAEPAPLLGFSADGAVAERALEGRFDADLSAKAIGARLKLMAAWPNQVGSPHDKANAEFTLQQFKAWGWDAHTETFSVLYPTPKTELLELLGKTPYRARLVEPPIPGDATTYRQAGGLPAWLIYGADGDVTAPLVYVNYGMAADYETLRRMGVSVRGKIVIARYGGGWRGLKPKLAYEHGAIGCIIYSDPADDGFATGDAYPKGPARPAAGIQRGSVADWPMETGDPLTPGYGATAAAPRIPLAAAKTLQRIPAIPISWGEAIHFLAPLGGPVAPETWRGALPITYHLGGDGPAVRLKVEANWDRKPAYDVIAVMKGASAPDQWVIRGNHRDGWVFGAQDPLAGQTAMMEEAKAIGGLARTGWRPARTIIYASWDGEEPDLLGSTEWAETHASELQSKAVIYINSDTNDRGFLFAGASYSLRALIEQTAEDVPDPQTGVSVRARALDGVRIATLAGGHVAKSEHIDALPVGDLGTGSDFTPFVQHLGIASIDIGFGGEGQSEGVYHSAYDTFEHFARFGDPGFAYGVVLARTAGRMVLRMADAEVLPFSFANLATQVGDKEEELKQLVATKKAHATAIDRLLDQHAFAIAADPRHTNVAPERESLPPDLDFSAMDAAVARLKAVAKAYDAILVGPVTMPNASQANLLLQQVEPSLLDPDGLPGRPWYRHLLYAPGVLTGYGAKSLPGIREAIEAGRWSQAQSFIVRTARVLDAASTKIDAARRALSG